jgi:hypothetical protein
MIFENLTTAGTVYAINGKDVNSGVLKDDYNKKNETQEF